MQVYGARLIRFCIVGGTVTAVYYVLLLGFTALGFHYVVANSIGWLICVCLNFVLNRRFTFKRRSEMKVDELVGFATTYLLQYLLGTGVLVVLVEGADLALTSAFLLTLLATTLFSYASLARFVFKHRNLRDPSLATPTDG